jgi:lipopolysaccharide export system protein LptA
MPQRPAIKQSGTAAALPTSGHAHRMARTLLTAAGLLFCFGAYSLATRPFNPTSRAAPRRQASEPKAPKADQDQTVAMAQRYLAHAPWAASANCRGQTPDSSVFYYFQSCKQESDKVARFEPFALLWRRKGSKPSDPMHAIVADSAYVTFESKFSLTGGNPGAILRAGLEGDVRIDGPNGLLVTGRRFFFEREAMRVYSDDPLQFRFDRHSGRAKGVQIELERDEKARPKDALPVAGVTSLKLLQNVEMTLISDASQSAGLPGRKRGPSTPQPVEIRSAGSFIFVLATREARFERQVRIWRETAPGKVDRLEAPDSVDLVFEAREPQGPAKGKRAPAMARHPGGAPDGDASPGTGTLDANLKFKSLHARGRPVTLVSDANTLRAVMHDFYYDQPTREARLSAGQDRVVVHHQDSRTRAPQIVLLHDDKSTITHIRASGPGDLEHYDSKTRQLDLSADWRKEMRKSPDPKSDFDLIDLEQAIIEQPLESSGIAADYVRLWIERQGGGQRRIAANLPPGQRRDRGPQIDHMLAWQNVALVNPQIEAETERLEVWFDPPPPLAPSKPTPDRADKRVGFRDAREADSAARRSRIWLLPTSGHRSFGDALAASDATPAKTKSATSAKKADKSGAAPAASRAAGQNTPPAEPYRLRAAVIRVQVVQGNAGQKAEVKAVVSKGNVQLAQAQSGGSGDAFVVEGNELQMDNRGELDQTMVVLGQPARIHARDSHIEGGRIRVDRQKGTADVDGAGRLQLPLQQAPLDVEWQRQMHFDGTTARFQGSVRTTIEEDQGKSEIRCRTMRAILDKPFLFTQQRKPEDQPQVDSIVCEEGVDLESDYHLNGRLVEVRRGRFAQLTLYRATSKAQATGPGLLRVWRHTENGRSGLSQLASVQSNKPKTRQSYDWEYMQITFAGRMEGDFSKLSRPTNLRPAAATQSRPTAPDGGGTGSLLSAKGGWESKFEDDVQVLFGPVDQPMETISRDELSDQAGWLGARRLEVLQVPQSPSQDQHIKLLSTGNAQVEGKTFRGEADIISYDGSKGLYVLRGENGHRATIWRQLQVGAELSRSVSNVVQFNPAQNAVKLDQISGLDGIE